MDIMNGLTSAAKILREADKIEQYQQILEAQKALLDYQKKIGELEGENKKLKDIQSFKETANFQNNCYWIKGENAKTDGPFCSKCVETDDRIIRLHVRHSDGYATCPNCKNHVWSRGEPNHNFSHSDSFFSNPAM
jgi:hypothetical protein